MKMKNIGYHLSFGFRFKKYRNSIEYYICIEFFDSIVRLTNMKKTDSIAIVIEHSFFEYRFPTLRITPFFRISSASPHDKKRG